MPPLPALGHPVEAGSSWPAAERRAHRRVALTAPLKIQSGAIVLDGNCRNISVGGLAALIEGRVEAGSELALAVSLPDGPEIQMRGEVVRVDGSEVGVRFLALGQTALLAILSYVGSR